MPKAFARATTAAMAAADWLRRSAAPATRLRSILRTPAGMLTSCPSDEKPLPKSSIATSTPDRRKAANCTAARSGSSATVVSVSSTINRSGGRPAAASAAATSSAIVPAVSEAALTLTLTSERQALVCPLRGLPGGGREHPSGQRGDQVVDLRHGDEVTGWQQSSLGMLPADQGLDAMHPPGREMQDRLVVEDELVGLDRLAQLAGHSHFLLHGVPEVPAEHLHPAAAAPLGRVHRKVGVSNQVGRPGSGGVAALRGRDPDARGQPSGAAVEVEGLVEDALETLGQCDSARRVTVPAEDDELVTTEPADGVLRPGPGDQPPGDLAQQVVTHLVSQGVVDVLEAVDIQEEDGDRRSVRPLQFGVDELVESSTVRQCSEVVVPGLPRRHPLRLHPVGHIGVGDDDLPFLAHPRGLQVVPAGAGRMPHGVVRGNRFPLAAGQRPQRSDDPPTDRIPAGTPSHREVVDPDTPRDAVVADRFDRGLPRAVGQQDDAVGVQQYGRRRQGIEYCDGEDGRVSSGPLAAPRDGDEMSAVHENSRHIRNGTPGRGHP